MPEITCDLDLTRFAYVLSSRLEAMELTGRQAARLCGCSTRQVSHAVNGKRIGAGATYMLAQLADIDLDDMLPTATRERLWKIRKLQQKHAVTPPVTRETIARKASATHAPARVVLEG